MLAFEILTYAKVCCGFSVFASLKIPLVIQLLVKRLSQHNLLDSLSKLLHLCCFGADDRDLVRDGGDITQHSNHSAGILLSVVDGLTHGVLFA